MPVNRVDRWFEAATIEQRHILEVLRDVILAGGPGVVEEFKWGRPWYSNDNGGFCYLHRTKNHVTLGFRRGAHLKDPKGLLEGDGKDMRHIKLTSEADARKPAVGQLVKQAAKLAK